MYNGSHFTVFVIFMGEFISFFFEHWILSTILIVLTIMFIQNEFLEQIYGVIVVSVTDFVKISNTEEAILIDIRAQEEFKLGHITGSVNLPQDMVENKVNFIKKNISQKKIILVCSTGMDAPRLARQLKTKFDLKGFLVLSGGVENWVASGLPLVKK